MPDRFHQLLLFDDKDFEGGHAHVFRTTRLGDIDWNGRVSAFAVTGGVWQFHRDRSFQTAYGSLFAPRRRGYSWVEDYKIDNKSPTSVSLWEDDHRSVPHLILFKKPNFEGDHKHLFSDLGNLTSWSDAGSLVIFAGVWQLAFTGGGLSGPLPPGVYPVIPFPPSPGGTPPQIAAIALLPTVLSRGSGIQRHLILFEHRDFGGNHRHVFTDIARLDDGWDKTVSSLAVEFGAWKMFQQQNFVELLGGTLTRGIYPWVDDIEIPDNSITSLQSLPLPPSDPPVISQTNINDGKNAFIAQGEHYRLGWNPHEMTLTPENVRVPYVKRLWARYDLDQARVYAQPLYVSNVTTLDGMTRDIVIVATAANNVFALDAQTGNSLWQHHLGEPLNDQEFSLGLSGGTCGNTSPLLLPPQAVGYTDPSSGNPVSLSMIVTAGKDGRAYFIPADLPGRVDPSLSEKQRDEMPGHAIWRPNIFRGNKLPDHGGIASAVAYFDAGPNGRFLYFVSASGVEHHGLVAIKLDDLNGETMLGARIIQFEGEHFTGAPGSPFVSSNGPDNGVVWAVDSFRHGQIEGGENSVLRAFDAMTGRLLYSSPQTDSQLLGNGRKFVGLTVINGKVLVPSQVIVCYEFGFEDV